MTFKLMIVEDELLERQALRKIISRNFQSIKIVAEAENGQQAIEFAKKYEPDIMLLDIGIPEINGLTAQKEIVKFLPFIQTIIISAYSDFTYAQKAISMHVKEYLLKPVRPGTIVDSITRVLNDLKKPTVYEQLPKRVDNNSVINQAIQIIEQSYMKNIRLDYIANQVHVNPQYLSRLFKQETNFNYSEYLTLFRLEKAMELLLNTDYPIFRIAQEVGFSDASYFCKVFSKHKNISPNKFRNKDGKFSFHNLVN